MLTEGQIVFAAKFWTDKLREAGEEPRLCKRFEQTLTTVIRRTGTKAVCCNPVPSSTLTTVMASLEYYPGLPVAEVIFMDDGTVWVWEDGEWTTVNPPEPQLEVAV